MEISPSPSHSVLIFSSLHSHLRVPTPPTTSVLCVAEGVGSLASCGRRGYWNGGWHVEGDEGIMAAGTFGYISVVLRFPKAGYRNPGVTG
ncbi:hypothetical protein VNO78_08416 [Psophocarpus tetragonolobus]|uniref:Uncharacterized protein n=1 Tax=Psophocarpus tetragonolobus TaxID=3891 RepID=A0AAN9SUY9_PSOTE